MSNSNTNKNIEPTSQNQPKKLFEVKKIFAIATWAYDTKIEKCAICQHHIMDQCIQCRSANKTGECVAKFGKCDHVFNDHCIKNWVEKHNGNCPFDGCDKKFQNQEWRWTTFHIDFICWVLGKNVKTCNLFNR